MRRRSISLGLVFMATLGLAMAARAQPDPEFIRRWSMPVEGAPLAESGPYEVVSEPAFDSPRHIVVRPADLDAFPTRDSMPVLVRSEERRVGKECRSRWSRAR